MGKAPTLRDAETERRPRSCSIWRRGMTNCSERFIVCRHAQTNAAIVRLHRLCLRTIGKGAKSEN